MNRTEHTFTRDGIVYDCVAKADSFAGVSGFRKRPMVTGRTWWAFVPGGEYATIRWTGQELCTTAARLEFEDQVVAMVGRQRPLPADSSLANPTAATLKPLSRSPSRITMQSTVCPLCREEDGVTGAGIRPRVTEIRCSRCGEFHVDDIWMAWADSTLVDSAEAREAFSRQSCEANASGLLLELTEASRGTPLSARPLPPRRARDL